MAGFGFTEAHEMFRREVRDFVREELVPGAKERAKQEMPRKWWCPEVAFNAIHDCLLLQGMLVTARNIPSNSALEMSWAYSSWMASPR